MYSMLMSLCLYLNLEHNISISVSVTIPNNLGVFIIYLATLF